MDELDLSEPISVVGAAASDVAAVAKEAYTFECSESVWNDIISCTADGSLFLKLADVPSLILGKHELALERRSTTAAASEQQQLLGLVHDNSLTLVAAIDSTLSVKPGAVPQPIASAPQPTINPSLLLSTSLPNTVAATATAATVATTDKSAKRKRVISKATISDSSVSDDDDRKSTGGLARSTSSTKATTTKAPRTAVSRLAKEEASKNMSAGENSSTAPTPISSPRLGATTRTVGTKRKNHHRRSESVSSTASMAPLARSTTKPTAAHQPNTGSSKKKRRSYSHGSAAASVTAADSDSAYQGSKLRKSTSSAGTGTMNKKRKREERWYSSTDDEDDVDHHRQQAVNGNDNSPDSVDHNSSKLKVEIEDVASFESYKAQFKEAYPAYLKLHTLLIKERDRVEASSSPSIDASSSAVVDADGDNVVNGTTTEQKAQGTRQGDTGNGNGGYELDEIERLVKRLRKERDALEAIKAGLEAFALRRRRSGAK